MALAVGTPAPDFTLKSRQGGEFKEVTLSDNFGKRNTVLLFFPAAFAPPCTAEMCGVSNQMSEYAGLDAEVYGISADSPFAQEAWAVKEGIAFPLLSDYKRQAIQDYDVVLPDLVGLGPGAVRSAFVVDKEGVIRHVETTATPMDQPDFEAVKQALRNLS